MTIAPQRFYSDNWRELPVEAKDRLIEKLKREVSAQSPRDPVGWAEFRQLNWWSAQRAIAQSVLVNRRTAVRAGHAVGKSYTAAGLACWWADTKADSMVVTTAPTAAQVHAILWEEMRRLHRRLRLKGRALLNDTWLIDEELVAFGRKPQDVAQGTENDPGTFSGIHRPGGVLVILDEAGGVPPWLWNACENITTSDNSRILAIGNPDNPGSHFAEVCEPGHPGWNQLKIAVGDSPNFTGEDVPETVLAALVTEAWRQDREDEWGTDNPLYISKVLAEFPKDHPDQIVPFGPLMECCFPQIIPDRQLVPVALGIDVGGGADMTVIRERKGPRLLRRWQARTPEPEQAANLATLAIRQAEPTIVNIDAIGWGWGLVGDLRRAQERGEIPRTCSINAIKVSESSNEPEKYANLRAELWWGIGRNCSMARSWDLSMADDPDTVKAQLFMSRWKPTPTGLIQVEAKKDIRERSGNKSPDDADAALLAFYVPPDPSSSYWDALNQGVFRR